MDEIVKAIDGEIDRLKRARAVLGGTSTPKPQAIEENESQAVHTKKRRKLSPEARKKIADAQKKRWANAKKAA